MNLIQQYYKALEPIKEKALAVILYHVPNGYALKLSDGHPKDYAEDEEGFNPENSEEDFMDEMGSMPSFDNEDGDPYGIWRIRNEDNVLKVDGISWEDSEFTADINIESISTIDICELADYLNKINGLK